MKISTWNVNSVRARVDCLDVWIKQEAPDVVLLQEIKCQKEAFPFDFFNNLGYQAVVYSQKSYNGVAIVSKYSIEDVVCGLPTFEDNAARYIEAVINGNVRVASIYVPNGGAVIGGESYLYKLEFLKQLKNYLDHIVQYQEMILIGGDYNIAPDNQDVYDEKIWHDRVCCTTEEREFFEKLQQSGFEDALKVFLDKDVENLNKKRPFTWWDYRSRSSFLRNTGLRLDHFLMNMQAFKALSDIQVNANIRTEPRPSDHAPVTCIIN